MSRWLLVAALAGGCAPAPSTREAPQPLRGPRVEFSFLDVDGHVVDSESTHGRATALLFVTTFDAASQLAASQLDRVLLHVTPRANGVAIVIEPPLYQPMAEVFRTSLGLKYPVAVADDATREGRSAFGKIERVPSIVILDREGRIAAGQAGRAEPREIEAALVAASGSAR